MIEINNKTRSRINLKLIEQITGKFLKHHNQSTRNVSIALVGDKTIKKLNKEYRKKDGPTDVLAFPGEGKELGELIIDYAQIKRQAKKFSPNIQAELVFILVHGLLHLLGYEDKTAKGKREMEKLGKEFIKKIKT